MADLDDLPDLVDGADPPNTGTAINEAWWDLAEAALDGECRGATDPTRTPAQTTDEVLAARQPASGSPYASLVARLNAWEAQQYVTPAHVRNGFVLGNLLANDTFMMWANGDAAAPDFWTLSGTGAAVARCGVGQADTTVIPNQDHFSAKLTYGTSAAILEQDVLSPAAWASSRGATTLFRYTPDTSAYGAAEQEAYYYLIGHVYATTGNQARLAMHDGGGVFVYSPYHGGGGSFASLVAGPFNPASAQLSAQFRVETAGAAYVQCLSVIMTPLALPPMYIPGRVRYKTLSYYANNPATGVLTYFPFARPAFIIGAQMQCLTAGTVTAPTIDLLTPIGGVYSSLFATLPTIATGQLVGAAQACDPVAANYRRRTIRPALAASATQVDNTSLRLDYVDDGGATLRDLIVTIHYLEYDRPFDQFRAISDLGE